MDLELERKEAGLEGGAGEEEAEAEAALLSQQKAFAAMRPMEGKGMFCLFLLLRINHFENAFQDRSGF